MVPPLAPELHLGVEHDEFKSDKGARLAAFGTIATRDAQFAYQHASLIVAVPRLNSCTGVGREQTITRQIAAATISTTTPHVHRAPPLPPIQLYVRCLDSRLDSPYSSYSARFQGLEVLWRHRYPGPATCPRSRSRTSVSNVYVHLEVGKGKWVRHFIVIHEDLDLRAKQIDQVFDSRTDPVFDTHSRLFNPLPFDDAIAPRPNPTPCFALSRPS